MFQYFDTDPIVVPLYSDETSCYTWRAKNIVRNPEAYAQQAAIETETSSLILMKISSNKRNIENPLGLSLQSKVLQLLLD